MFADRLRLLRKEHGLTQIQFAKTFNVANGTIAMWETGRREPDFSTMLRISDFFHVSVDYLLGRDEETPPNVVDEGRLDEEIIGRLGALTPEEWGKVDAFVQGMIASRSKETSPPT